MPKKAPLPTSAKLAEDHLEPIRAFVHSRHGMLTTLTQSMNGKTSTPITRQAVSKWLHKNPSIRQEPKLGVALAMEAAVKEIQAGATAAE